MFGNFVNSLLGRKVKVVSKQPKLVLSRVASKQGITFSSSLDNHHWYFEPEKHEQWQSVAVLAQWLESGYARLDDNNAIFVSWQNWYQLTHKDNEDYAGADQFFNMPPASPLKLKLNARGSFSDPDFFLFVEWQEGGRAVSFSFDRTGGLLQQPDTRMHISRANGRGGFVIPKRYWLSAEYWQLLEAIDTFPTGDSALTRSQQQLVFEKAWGRVRKLALLADVEMVPILRNYHVITADELDIKLVKHGEALDDIEVQPIIIGADEQQWLKSYDAHWHAQSTYTWVNDDNETVKVVVDGSALEVLTVIRKMPNRRVKGELAERFLRNPAHVLGDAAERVLPSERFEKARIEAGIRFISFSCRLLCDKQTKDAISVILDLRDDAIDITQSYRAIA